MNWLAHVFLSEPDIEFRLGNLLADIVKRADRPAMPIHFQRGLRQHQLIDAFTDSHPIVHRSRARLKGNYRHTRGILIDIFYDHFLALDWNLYCPQPLEDFTEHFYSQIRRHPACLPDYAQTAIDHILATNRLMSYRSLDGIRSALRSLSQRLSIRLEKEFALDGAVAELAEHFVPLHADFREFFPELVHHVKIAWRG